MTVSFIVPGVPRPAGSKRAFGVRKGGQPTGKFVLVDSSGQAGKDWRGDVQAKAEPLFPQPLTGPVYLDVMFRLPRPKAHYRTGRRAGELRPDAPDWHTSKPDRTKLLRSIEDALTGIAWRDDAQVCNGICQKIYSDKPGAFVTVHGAQDAKADGFL